MTPSSQENFDGRALVDMYDRMRRAGSLLVLLAFGLFFIFALIFSATRPPLEPLDASKLGVHMLLDDGRNTWSTDLWPTHFEYAQRVAAPGGIVVQLVRSDDLDIARWQLFMDLAAQHNLTPVLRLATTFDEEAGWWRAPEPGADGGYTQWGQRYADFVNGLDWPTSQKHLILLNEPNNGVEWSGQPEPAAYARFVMDVAAALRVEVPDVVLLNAALDLYAPHTGAAPFAGTNRRSVDANTFMDAMHAAEPEVFAQFDIWNNHSYPLGPFRLHPRAQEFHFDDIGGAVVAAQTPPAGTFNRGINGYAWELWRLEQFGVTDIPVMITETGWRHAETTDAGSLDAGADYPSATLVAQYYDMALRGSQSPYTTGALTWTPWLADERVIAVAPFALNGVPHEWGHTNWLALDETGAVLETYAPFDFVIERILTTD